MAYLDGAIGVSRTIARGRGKERLRYDSKPMKMSCGAPNQIERSRLGTSMGRASFVWKGEID